MILNLNFSDNHAIYRLTHIPIYGKNVLKQKNLMTNAFIKHLLCDTNKNSHVSTFHFISFQKECNKFTIMVSLNHFQFWT